MLVVRPFACLKPNSSELMDRDDQLSRRGRFPARGGAEKDLYRVKISLERFIKRATVQHKLVCIAIRRMEQEDAAAAAAETTCTGASCEEDVTNESPWAPNASWTTDLDENLVDM
jgi:hypothetical protein